MPSRTLFEEVKQAVVDDRYMIGRHANERLRDRRIAAWQIISGVESSTLLAEIPAAQPNPVVEVEQLLADGTPVKVVWAWLEKDRTAKLVTVHYFDK